MYVIGVYNPNDSVGGREVRSLVYTYINGKQQTIQEEGGRLLLGGDWNAVQKAEDRHSMAARPGTAADSEFQKHLRDSNLTSIFGYDADRPWIYFRSSLEGGEQATSRRDDWLCSEGGDLQAAARNTPQKQVIQDIGLWPISDHYPVVLDVKYTDMFASFPAPLPPKRAPRRSILRLIAEPHRKRWADGVAAEYSWQASRLAVEMAGLQYEQAELLHEQFTEVHNYNASHGQRWP